MIISVILWASNISKIIITNLYLKWDFYRLTYREAKMMEDENNKEYRWETGYEKKHVTRLQIEKEPQLKLCEFRGISRKNQIT